MNNIRYFFTLFLFFFIPHHIQAQCYSNLEPVTTEYFDTYFKNTNEGFVVGGQGNMIRTMDAGDTWEHVDVPFNRDLYRIKFITDTHGIAWGQGTGFILTTDGGTTWDYLRYNFNTSYNSSPRDIYMDENGDGFIITNGGSPSFYTGQVIKVQNFGEELELLNLHMGTPDDFNSMYFFDATSGYIVGDDGFILSTVDGGETWTKHPQSGENSLLDFEWITFINASEGFIFSDDDYIFKTDDGGETWYEHSSAFNGTTRLRIQFVSDQVAYASLFDDIMKTSDGGLTWSYFANGEYSYFVAEDEGYILSNNGTSSWGGRITKAIAGNMSWEWDRINQIRNDKFLHIDATDDVVIVAGDEGQFFRSEDNGLTWAAYYSYDIIGQSDYNLRDVKFVTDNQVIGMFSGSLIYSNDAGLTWTNIDYNFSWSGAAGLQEDQWFIYDYSRDFIRKTSNAGGNWTNFDLGFYPREFHFLNALEGYASSSSNEIYKTTDGGETWTATSFYSLGGISDIFFFNTSIGYVGCDGGYYYKTVDGGVSWTQTTIGSSNQFISGISFGHEMRGVLTAENGGANGFSYETIDGGETWTKISSIGQSTPMTCSVHLSPSMALLAGYDGSFYILGEGKPAYLSPLTHTFKACVDELVPFSFSIEDVETYYYTIDGVEQAPTNESIPAPSWSTPGTHTVSLYVDNACGGPTDEVTMEIIIEDNLDNIEITQVDENTLMANTQPNYQWFKDSEIIPGATEQTLTISESGLYTLESYNACGSMSGGLFVESVSNEDILSDNKISIQPNPTPNQTIIQSSVQMSMIELFNLEGKTIKSLVVNQQYEQVIDVSDLAPGMYYLHIQLDNGSKVVQKMIRQ